MNTKMYILQGRLEGEREHLLEQLKDNLDVTDEIYELTMHLAKQHLREVEYALYKFELGTYGLCDLCGQPIEPERLEALPQANLCLNCKTHEVERNTNGKTRGQFHYHQYDFEPECEEN